MILNSARLHVVLRTGIIIHQEWSRSICLFLAYIFYCWYVTSRCDLDVWCWPWTLSAVKCSNAASNISEIEQSTVDYGDLKIENLSAVHPLVFDRKWIFQLRGPWGPIMHQRVKLHHNWPMRCRVMFQPIFTARFSGWQFCISHFSDLGKRPTSNMVTNVSFSSSIMNCMSMDSIIEVFCHLNKILMAANVNSYQTHSG